MRNRSAVLLALVILASFPPAYAQEHANGAKGPSAFGLPERLRSLTDLQRVKPSPQHTEAQRTMALLYWLIQERCHPSPTQLGYGGGEITSPYIEAQIIKCLRAYGDLHLLDALAGDPGVDISLRQVIQLVLGLKGDRRQAPVLVFFLRTHPLSEYRCLAAEALGDLGDRQFLPLLDRVVLEDDARVCRDGTIAVDDDTPAHLIVFPVREIAAESAGILRNESACLRQAQRSKRIAGDLTKTELRPKISDLPGWFTATMHTAFPNPNPTLRTTPPSLSGSPMSR